MINVFVAVGTHEIGFPRLCRAISNLDSSVFNVVIQAGATRGLDYPKKFKVFNFLNSDQMTEYSTWSDFLISQTSPGLIQLAWNNSSVSISCPRSKVLGEAVDNHQFEFGKFLEPLGGTILIDEKTDLKDLLINNFDKTKSIITKQMDTLELFESRKLSVANFIRHRIENL